MLDLVLALGLITAWLYTVGWSYASHYFGYFHVGLLALEVPAESFLIYGFWVLRNHLALFIVLSLLAVGLAVARGSIGRVPAGARRGLVAVLPIVVLGVFWGGYGLAEATSRTQFLSDREADFPAHPRVRVWVDPGWANAAPLAPLAGQLAQGCHRLLAQSRETVFLFRSLAPVLPAGLPLVQVPSAAVQAMRVLPRYESCRPDAATPR